MPDTNQTQAVDVESRRRRLAVMARLQEIEGNKLTDEDLAMFEMFEREGWSDDRCRAYIIAQAHAAA